MSGRYTELFRLPSALICEECPVVIEAGTLLKDNANGHVLAQLKLTNLSNQNLIACKVLVKPVNPYGAATENVEFHYLDMNVSKGVPFGTRQPIYLPDDSSRSYDVSILEIAFDDGSVWNNEASKWISIGDQAKISEYLYDADLEEQFYIEEGKGALFVPERHTSHWRCTCGALNLYDSNACYKCNRNIISVEEHLNKQYLTERLALRREENERLEQERVARAEEEKKKIEEERRKKEEEKRHELELKRIKAKNIIIIVATCVILCGISIVFYKVVLPKIWYQKAESLEKKGDYEKAFVYYDKIGKDEEAENAAILHIKDLVLDNKFQEARLYAQTKKLPQEVENEIFRIESIKSGMFDEIKNAEIGDNVTFGKRPIFKNGVKINNNKNDYPAEWFVVDRDNDKVLLLASMPYWDVGTCKYDTLDEYLDNGELKEIYDNAFTKEEKSLVIESEHEIEIVRYNGIRKIESLTEKKRNKLFSLSIEEVEKYRYRLSTFEKNDIYRYKSVLRGIRELEEDYYLIVLDNNKAKYLNSFTNSESLRYQPAMWVDLSSDFNESVLENRE